MWRARSPGAWLMIAGYACVAMIAMVLFVALRLPAIGVTFVADGEAVAVVGADGRQLARLAPDAVVRLESSGGKISQKARELVADFAPDGEPHESAAWFATRSRLAASVEAAPVRLTLGNRSLTLQSRSRTLGDLSGDVWLLLGQGFAFGLLGIWMALLRPHHWGARMFLVSCLGLVAASFSGALYDARELAANGTLLRSLQVINFTGSIISAAGLLALYALQPRPLIGPTCAVAVIVVAALWGIVAGLGWLPLAAFYGALLSLCVAFFALLIVQWVRCRDDPAHRAALRWVGVTSFVGTTTLSLAMATPHFVGGPSLGSDGLTVAPLFLVYGSIAFGIGNSRLFDLDRWTFRIILGALAASGFLAVDAALIAGLRVESTAALALSLLIVGYLYLPLRTLVWRRIVGRPQLTDSELFQIATEVAFAAAPADRRDGWRALLQRLFDPLEIRASDQPFDHAAILDGGAALAIPATGDETALRLSFRSGGRKLFGPDEVRLAREVVVLMRRAEAARAEYTRGVDEERQRIAQDLHDEVCAVLLTSLHREDVGAVRADVRTAMSDIRTIISGLTGERVALDQIVADLRYETASRLAAAGIELDWPLPDEPYEARLLDYPTYKSLIASHREIVSNILKHSGATRVTVHVDAHASALVIVVEDNGVGIVEAPRSRAGQGLVNMRRRIRDIDGDLALRPTPEGTRVEVAIPLI